MYTFPKYLLATFLIIQPLLAEEKPLKIGVCLAMTGEAAKWSSAHKKGIELAYEEAKQNGEQVEVVFDDTGTSTVGSVKCFNKMANTLKVDAVIGNIWGYLTSPLMPLAEKNKIPLVTTSGFREKCPKNRRYFFSVSEQVSDLRKTYSIFLKNEKSKKVGIVYFDDEDWGKFNFGAVKGAVEDSGGTLLEPIKSSELHEDFRILFPKILQQNPDVIFVYHEPLSTTKVLRELNYKGIIVQSNAVGEQMNNNGSFEGVFNEVYFADQTIEDSFKVRFTNKFKEVPRLEPHSGYDALSVLIQAHKTNSNDLSTALLSGSFKGVKNEITFKESCAGKNSTWKLYQIKENKPVDIF